MPQEPSANRNRSKAARARPARAESGRAKVKAGDGAPGETTRAEVNLYRRLIEGITDYAIYLLDPTGVVSSWNPGAQRFKGYTASEIIGQHFSRFYTAEDRATGLPDQALRIAAAEGRFEREGWRMRKDGSRFWAHVVIDPIRDDDGELVGFAKITRDLSERREAQRALEETREALFQSQKMEAVGQLTGGVAHDFNNLLTVIIGGLETIKRAGPTETARISRALDMALHAADRAASLTTRLLAFSRRSPLQPIPTDLNLLVRNMTDMLHRTLGEDVELEGVLSPRLWPASVDQNQLEAAILNLAVNARDAMPGGGKLTLETANTSLDESYAETDSEVIPGQYTMISVSDTGSGMDKATAARVFEPFFTTKELGRGTGLGLSMVYGFVKQSGGHVTIYSEPGQGTTVRLYLPRLLGEAAAAVVADDSGLPHANTGEIVLVVEDNDDVRANSVLNLTELGYQALEAPTAEAGLEVLKRDQRIDLLFSDVVLPGKNGRALADEAGQLRPGLKVLLTTGYSYAAIVHQGRLDPGVQLISKPFTFDQLARKVRDVLDQPLGKAPPG